MAMTPEALIVYPPAVSGVTTVSPTRVIQRLTGTTSQSCTSLNRGYATLMVTSAMAVRVRFTAGASTAVTTDMEIPQGGRFDWLVDDNSRIVSAIATDGTSTFECFVWSSSPLTTGV